MRCNILGTGKMDLCPQTWSELEPELIYKIVEHLDLRQRLQFARVSKALNAAVASCQGLTVEGEIDPAAFQKWLQHYGGNLKTLNLRGGARATLVDMKGLLASGRTLPLASSAARARPLVNTPFPGIADATNLTSLILSNVSVGREGRALLAALTALPELRLLSLENLRDVWWESPPELDIEYYTAKQLHTELAGAVVDEPAWCYGRWKVMPWHERNAPRYIMKQLTSLTNLHLKGPELTACLYNLGELTQLLQLSLDDMDVAIQKPGGLLHGLNGVTSLHLPVPCWLAPQQQLGLSSLTALQQLQLSLHRPGAVYGVRAFLDEAFSLEHLTSLSLVTQATPAGYGEMQLAFSGLSALQQLKVEVRVAGKPDDVAGSPPCGAQLWRVQLPHMSLQACCESWGCLRLQHLHLQHCDLHYSNFPIPKWSNALPAGRQLTELTSLQLYNVQPELQASDLPALVNACPALKSLHTCTASTELGELTALLLLSQLTSLGFKDAGDAAFAAVGQLTGLRELRVHGYCRATLGGLRELTALQQLTSLGFTAEMRAATMSEVLASALSGWLAGCRFALVNQAVAGCPPDVWSQLLAACYMAETADDAPPSDDDESVGLCDDAASDACSDLAASFDSATIEDDGIVVD